MWLVFGGLCSWNIIRSLPAMLRLTTAPLAGAGGSKTGSRKSIDLHKLLTPGVSYILVLLTAHTHRCATPTLYAVLHLHTVLSGRRGPVYDRLL